MHVDIYYIVAACQWLVHVCGLLWNLILMNCWYNGNIVEWMSDCCFTPNEWYFNYIMPGTGYIGWDDNDICLVLTRPTCLVGFIQC